jgi:hypothetical protein
VSRCLSVTAPVRKPLPRGEYATTETSSSLAAAITVRGSTGHHVLYNQYWQENKREGRNDLCESLLHRSKGTLQFPQPRCGAPTRGKKVQVRNSTEPQRQAIVYLGSPPERGFRDLAETNVGEKSLFDKTCECGDCIFNGDAWVHARAFEKIKLLVAAEGCDNVLDTEKSKRNRWFQNRKLRGVRQTCLRLRFSGLESDSRVSRWAPP